MKDESVSAAYVIDGSGLFHWQSRVSDEKKLRIIEWFNEMPKQHREYVEILISEGYSNGYETGANDESL